MSTMWRVLGLAAMLTASGCTIGQANLVRRDQFGGVLALEGHHQTALDDAHVQMSMHCQGEYTVVQHESVALGEPTPEGGRAATEYRITYQCGIAPPDDDAAGG